MRNINRIGKTITVVLENKTAAGKFHYSVVGDQHHQEVSRNQVEVLDGDEVSKWKIF